jgi:dephospho-CoA kinase
LAAEMHRLMDQGVRVAVLDAPVMLKAGWDRLCDQIWFVDCPYEIRLKRAQARGWSEDEFRRRELAQEPVDRKRELADLVLDNSRDIAYTHQQIERFWHSLIG